MLEARWGNVLLNVMFYFFCVLFFNHNYWCNSQVCVHTFVHWSGAKVDADTHDYTKLSWNVSTSSWPRHRPLYWPVVKCHLGSHVSAGIFRAFTLLQILCNSVQVGDSFMLKMCWFDLGKCERVLNFTLKDWYRTNTENEAWNEILSKTMCQQCLKWLKWRLFCP